jgi:hypothetical protein
MPARNTSKIHTRSAASVLTERVDALDGCQTLAASQFVRRVTATLKANRPNAT